MTMDRKEYLIAVFFGFSSMFVWILWCEIAFEMLIYGKSTILLNWLSIFNVYYIFGITFFMFCSSLALLWYLWHYAGMDKKEPQDIHIWISEQAKKDMEKITYPDKAFEKIK